MNKDGLNNDAIRFIQKNGIDIDSIRDTGCSHIMISEEINEIVADNLICKAGRSGDVSIADVLGFELSSDDSDLFTNIKNLFDSNGDGYHCRSVGMLEYSSDEIMGNLRRSFQTEKMELLCFSDTEYLITDNGRHRFTVLRAHYLSEYIKVKDDEEAVAQLRKKYEFPASISDVDYVKTYSHFILKTVLGEKCSVRADWDTSYNYTGKSFVRYPDGQSVTLTDEELIDIVRENIELVTPETYQMLSDYTDKIPSFRDFSAQYIPEVVSKPQIDDGRHL